MERKEKRNKSHIIIGSFIFIIGLSLVVYDYYSNKKIEQEEQQAIEQFYEIIEEDKNEEIIEPQTKEEVKINYIAILKIPKINLERGLVNPDSYLNNIDYNIAFVNGSSMPDEINGNVILASHSGNARISYFRKLDQLDINDSVSIIYKNKEYNYKVIDKYDIEKNGQAEIRKKKNTTTLTLITCRHNTNNQIVIICELI